MTDKPWPVLVHLNAASLVDEGPGEVFDIVQEKVTPTGVLFAAHGFNPEVIDRGKIWPGHGPRGSNGSLGGYYATAHEESTGTSGWDFRGFAGRNSRVSTQWPSPKRRRAPEISASMSTILESAGTGGFQENVTGWTSILEIDVDGRRGKLPCVNHPDYRAWKLAILEESLFVLRI